MTQEEKNLLIKDICCRLPYRVKAEYYDPEDECETWDEVEGIDSNKCVEIGQYSLPIESVKPYLFPLSSMSEEQLLKYHDNCDVGLTEWGNELYYDCVESISWLIENHFDIYGLIPKNLAIDATGLNIY